MKKIILSAMAVMFSLASMAVAPALATMNGVYSTTAANIYVPAGYATPVQTSAMNITLTAQADDEVLLSIPSFTFGTGTNAIEFADGISMTLKATYDETLSAFVLSNINTDGETGPDTEVSGQAISTKIIVQGTSQIVPDETNVLLIDLKVNGTEKSTSAPMLGVARIEITDASFTSTAVKENTVLNVYPTIAENVVNVPENGEFIIYSVGNGAAVKSGVVNNGTVSVADLAKGNYILSVNGKNARFIKK